ncbi:flagellar basal body-associated protein FliL [Alteromonas gilva]|uniref:Flagellar protein FliL n=1 Tax=Alteromonas gilva TaxID=2987522 RepID=A0ABT5L7P3_9ALTE|nr:flagellar basal body-associated protein FliL [Alteromonas gilva]MDC8831847.1 flagellar basal body-associated protein FliL [Alteromonas gilva]
MKHLLLLALLLGASFCPSSATAQEQTSYAYIGIEPEIVTNYLGQSATRLGYVRVMVELMVEDVDQLELVEHHMPLLRSTAIEIFGQQPEEKVKSLTGREDIRRAILAALQDHMQKETGAKVIKNVIFTKYLHNA